MREVEIVKHTAIGEAPHEFHSITFRILTQMPHKKFTISNINHGDYAYFEKAFDADNAKGWKGYDFLAKKYTPIEDTEISSEEDEQIKKGFDDFWKTHPKPSSKK